MQRAGGLTEQGRLAGQPGIEPAGHAMGRVTQLALQMRQPGMTNDDTHRSMRMFAADVIPALER